MYVNIKMDTEDNTNLRQSVLFLNGILVLKSLHNYTKIPNHSVYSKVYIFLTYCDNFKTLISYMANH